MSANEQLSTQEQSDEPGSETGAALGAAEQADSGEPVKPLEKPEKGPEVNTEALGDSKSTVEEIDPTQVWGTDTDPKFTGDGPNPSDRREAMRKGVRLNKLISAQLLGEDHANHHLYLHLVDISEGGMRVNGDMELVDDKPFSMLMQTEPFGPEIAAEFPEMAVTCRVVWQKRLLGGMFVSGLQFMDKTPEIEHALKRILEICSPEGRRLRFRLNRVLGVGIGLDDQTRWLYPLALDLSVEGMRVRLDEPLKVGETFPLQIFLEFDLPTVQMSAEVMWKEEIGPSRFQVGLRFHDLSEDNAKAIQSYIDRCLAKELK